MRLVDMHCHLDLMANGLEIAREAEGRGVGFFCTTVTPDGTQEARRRFAPCPNVRVGVGLHPWWLADGTCGEPDVERACELAAEIPYLGELGLDGGKRGAGTQEAQAGALRRILRSAAAHPLAGRVASFHAVRSADAVIGLVEETGLAEGAACILHWFSGTSDELWRAVRAGFLFSVNEHMLATKRGREYARILPEDRLLIETDAPPELGAPYELDRIERSLESTLERVAELRGCDPEALGTSIARRSAALLRLSDHR